MGYFYTELSGEVDTSTGNVTLSLHPQIPKEFYKHFFTVTCFADKTRQRPVHHASKVSDLVLTAGTVVLEASDDGVNFGSITNGTVDLSGSFDRPNMEGRLKIVEAEITGITPTQVAGVATGMFVVIGIHSYS